MTVQMLNTKAEQTFLQAFETNAHRLPGDTAVQALRRAAIGAFAAKGLPGRRVEEWKYTDLKSALKDAFPLAAGSSEPEADVLVAPYLGEDLQRNALLFADGRSLRAIGNVFPVMKGQPFLQDVLKSAPGWVTAALGSVAIAGGSADLLLNAALFTDGAVIDVTGGTAPEEPVVIVSAAGRNNAEGASIALRHLIRVGRGAKVTIIEADTSGSVRPRQSSALTQIDIADGAEVTHVKIVATAKGSVHLGHWQVSLGASAVYRPFQLTLGEGLVRNGLNLAFNGSHATFDYGAASIVHGTGHADNTMVIDHRVPHCTSRELFKTVLDGQARSVFQGKVIVQPHAQKTDGKQMAQALMLSPDAEFYSKPELEIYADDVACGHGSTAAEIDPDLVFYCTSRGIPAATARGLLIESFIGEAIGKVEHEGLRDALTEMARASLSGATGAA